MEQATSSINLVLPFFLPGKISRWRFFYIYSPSSLKALTVTLTQIKRFRQRTGTNSNSALRAIYRFCEKKKKKNRNFTRDCVISCYTFCRVDLLKLLRGTS